MLKKLRIYLFKIHSFSIFKIENNKTFYFFTSVVTYR
jgi:hypothetical protein